jgi:hypothetical protein
VVFGWALSHVTLRLSGGQGREGGKAGSDLVWPGQAAPQTSDLWASGALPKVDNLVHSLNHMSKGTTGPREGPACRLPVFPTSPGDAVSVLVQFSM